VSVFVLSATATSSLLFLSTDDVSYFLRLDLYAVFWVVLFTLDTNLQFDLYLVFLVSTVSIWGTGGISSNAAADDVASDSALVSWPMCSLSCPWHYPLVYSVIVLSNNSLLLSGIAEMLVVVNCFSPGQLVRNHWSFRSSIRRICSPDTHSMLWMHASARFQNISFVKPHADHFSSMYQKLY
jgi:hypothetical protein